MRTSAIEPRSISKYTIYHVRRSSHGRRCWMQLFIIISTGDSGSLEEANMLSDPYDWKRVVK